VNPATDPQPHTVTVVLVGTPCAVSRGLPGNGLVHVPKKEVGQSQIASVLASFKRVLRIPVTTPTMMSAISAWLGVAVALQTDDRSCSLLSCEGRVLYLIYHY
jgi:hypothetical protein